MPYPPTDGPFVCVRARGEFHSPRARTHTKGPSVGGYGGYCVGLLFKCGQPPPEGGAGGYMSFDGSSCETGVLIMPPNRCGVRVEGDTPDIELSFYTTQLCCICLPITSDTRI